jgi:hypothetical protein
MKPVTSTRAPYPSPKGRVDASDRERPGGEAHPTRLLAFARTHPPLRGGMEVAALPALEGKASC